VRARTDTGAAAAMINTKRVLLLLPLYLVWTIAVDVLFDSAGPSGGTSVPAWMIVGFIVSTVAVAGAVFWYLFKRGSGEVPRQRQHMYTALFVAIVASGFVDDALEGVAWILLGGRPWWVLVPIYTIGYAVCWVVLVPVANWLAHRAGDVADRRGSAR